VLEIKNENDNSILKLFLKGGHSITEKISVPTYLDVITLEYAGQSVEFPVYSDQLNYEFE
jgi:hypothetical protein